MPSLQRSKLTQFSNSSKENPLRMCSCFVRQLSPIDPTPLLISSVLLFELTFRCRLRVTLVIGWERMEREYFNQVWGDLNYDPLRF
ncbi:hypothetical protein TNCV_1352581 [Trichonephila clavipes]|nr:hypothetical protein TNCV_1352581 [Trichonephila clavipes]